VRGQNHVHGFTTFLYLLSQIIDVALVSPRSAPDSNVENAANDGTWWLIKPVMSIKVSLSIVQYFFYIIFQFTERRLFSDI
jgi:hypothetical protein